MGSGTPCTAADLLVLLTLLDMEQLIFLKEVTAPAPSNTIADLVNGNSCDDTDDNNADFTTGTPIHAIVQLFLPALMP